MVASGPSDPSMVFLQSDFLSMCEHLLIKEQVVRPTRHPLGDLIQEQLGV